MKSLFFPLIVSFCMLASYVSFSQDWQYLSQKTPDNQAVIFAPYSVSTNFNERDMAISPDGKEMCYSLVLSQTSAMIMFRRYENGKWQPAKAASFSGKFHDIEPAFSADGKKLFFASNRALTGTGTKDFDIWFVERNADDSWSAPKNMGSPINTVANEFYPSLDKNNSIYYTAKYAGGIGGEDIWVSKFENGAYQKPEVLSGLSTGKDEFNAFINPDGKYILFSSFGRADDNGGGDLYISLKNADGTWSVGRNIAFLNSSALDYCPYVSADGNYLFFTSEKTQNFPITNNPFKTVDLLRRFMTPANGRGDIYWVKMSEVLK